jgi:hypothetical protein
MEEPITVEQEKICIRMRTQKDRKENSISVQNVEFSYPLYRYTLYTLLHMWVDITLVHASRAILLRSLPISLHITEQNRFK